MLQPALGPPSRSVFDMARRGLRHGLRDRTAHRGGNRPVGGADRADAEAGRRPGEHLVHLDRRALAGARSRTGPTWSCSSSGAVSVGASPTRRRCRRSSPPAVASELDRELRDVQGAAFNPSTRSTRPRWKSCAAPTRSCTRLTRNCNPPTRSWKHPRRRSSPSTRSCKPSTPSFPPRWTNWTAPTATCATCSRAPGWPRCSWTITW